jgi:SAM-dependent methyltransferase
MISLLEIPAVYRLFAAAIGGKFRDRYVAEYVQPRAGDRILDIGCGPGDILRHLPDVRYLGVDMDARYIAAARKRFGNLGEFRCESATETVLREPASFDLVMANGVLHHLDDTEVSKVLTLARSALKPTGRLVAHDGAFLAEQSAIEALLLKMDRGRFVRTPDQYVRLARLAFEHVESVVRRGLLRSPYTHHIMTCRA